MSFFFPDPCGAFPYQEEVSLLIFFIGSVALP